MFGYIYGYKITDKNVAVRYFLVSTMAVFHCRTHFGFLLVQNTLINSFLLLNHL